MNLQSIKISRGYSGDQPLHGTIEFQSPDKYKFEVHLTEDQAIQITNICAASLAEIGRRAAESLTADALRSTAIEHQT